MIPHDVVLSQDLAVLVLMAFAGFGWVAGTAVCNVLIGALVGIRKSIGPKP